MMLCFWLSFLRLFAAEGEQEPPPEPAASAPADADPDPALEDLLDAPPDDEPAPSKVEPPRENEVVRELRERLARTEGRLEEVSRGRPNAEPAGRDPDYEREEAQLAQMRRDGADQNALYWAQWKIDRDRDARSARREAQDALRQAQDLADLSDFRSVREEDKSTFDRYAEKVEQAVRELRARGQTVPPRRSILAFIVGHDVLKAKGTKKAASPKPAEPARVDRGRMPGARSDVSGRPGAMTDAQKREARLKDQLI